MRRIKPRGRKVYYNGQPVFLNDNKFTGWIKGQTGKVVDNAKGSVQGAFDNLKLPSIKVTIDNKTKNTVLTACGILAGGMIGHALLKR